MYCREP